MVLARARTHLISKNRAHKAGLEKVMQRRTIFIGAAAVCVVAGIAYGIVRNMEAATATPLGPAAQAVVVAVAAEESFVRSVTGLGTVQAAGTVDIHAQITGTVTKIAFTEGQAIRAGDLIAEIDARPYEAALIQAEAQLARDQSQLSNSQRDLQRFQQLSEKGFASGQQLETQRAAVNQLQAAVKGDQAAISKARTDLSYTRITSPIDGVTGIRGIDAGNIIRPTDTSPIVTVTQIEPVTAIFTLPAQNLDAVRTGMAQKALVAEAFDQANTTLLSRGELTVVDNQIDVKTGMVRLKATFPNKDRKLWPGAFVNVRLQTNTKSNAVTIPNIAVQHGTDGVFAFVVKPDNTVERRAVTVGGLNGDIALIEAGINAGERVVVDGYARLTQGARVRILPGNGKQSNDAHEAQDNARPAGVQG
jgi:multidrug efflux system membrane fusion protein